MVTFVAIPAIATKTSRKSVNASITLEPELEPMPDELESESDFDEDDTQDDVIQLETIATTEFSKFNATAESAPTVEHGDPQKPDSNEFGLPRSRDANSFDDNTSCIDSNVMELLDGEFFEMLDNCSASSNDNEGFGETSVPAVIDVAGELCEFHDSCYSFPRHSEWQRDSQSSSDDQRSEKNCTSDWENKAPLATMDLSADEFVDTTLNTSTSFAPEPDGVYDKFDEGYIERDIHNDNNDTDVDDVACMSENPNVESRLNTANIALTQEKLPVQLTVGQINIPRLDEIARFATYHTLDADCVSKKILVINRIDEGWIEIARFAFRPNAIAARVAENRRQHLAIGHIQPVSRHEYTLY
ncbi:hypothetical protein JM18_002208 [Phytophthora kernoviae]|uniref:Uncharacterized protein n=2 Tax=Phytophthora kernoviae TaxID=325452 RepID=A0A922ARH5_9STRA|nr:hypothetical protein G195_008717 [Phytophthora kernoviae 00238/432]KAG2530340.1 hypothetical protein JM18_002208 [Phytophthora kernoviae]